MFKKYRRINVAEMRPINEYDIDTFLCFDEIEVCIGDDKIIVSISNEDKHNGSPKIGDMIARNPENHKDQWLVAEKYCNANFELIVE